MNGECFVFTSGPPSPYYAHRSYGVVEGLEGSIFEAVIRLETQCLALVMSHTLLEWALIIIRFRRVNWEGAVTESGHRERGGECAPHVTLDSDDHLMFTPQRLSHLR